VVRRGIVLVLVALVLGLPALREMSPHGGAGTDLAMKHTPRTPPTSARAIDPRASVPAVASPALAGTVAAGADVSYDAPPHAAPFVPPRS